MKKLFFALLMAAGTAAMAAYPAAGIAGTPHDLSSTGPLAKTNTTQTCVFCHTPHNAAPVASQLIPLWNHTASATTGFTMYNNTNVPVANLQGTVATAPANQSLVCFSCHDGTVAVISVLNQPSTGTIAVTTAGGGVNATGFIASGANLLGKDLTNDHPISITYQDNLDTGLRAPASFTQPVRLFPTNVTGSTVQCASCHDVHNYGAATNGGPFLRATMAGSALCVACHIK